MSKGEFVSYQQDVFYAKKEIVSPLPIIQYFSKSINGTVRLYISSHEIAGSASNEAITLDEDDNTMYTFLWDTSSGTSLTVKTNGDSDSRAVKPIRAIKGKLTSLTVSNSASSAVDLAILRIVISDTTNVVLREERR